MKITKFSKTTQRVIDRVHVKDSFCELMIFYKPKSTPTQNTYTAKNI